MLHKENECCHEQYGFGGHNACVLVKKLDF
jgi:hypothetical protein